MPKVGVRIIHGNIEKLYQNLANVRVRIKHGGVLYTETYGKLKILFKIHFIAQYNKRKEI